MSAPHDDRMPPWLSALGVKSGEYFIDSKHRARRAMKSTCFSPAARIHICLSLATMGFQQELAVKMEAGKRVPLTPADVCSQTGIRRKHFRRHMAELEAYGLAECRGSTKGRVEIYSWAIPRDVDRAKIVTARGDNLQIACEDGGPIPESLLSALRHFRLRSGFVAARGDIEELGRLVQVAKQAELSLRSYHDRLRAQQPHIRKKETITNIERNDERTKETEPEPTPEVPAPESRTVRPSVVPPASQMKEELRTWLTARTELFGLPTLPDDAVLNQIAAHVTDEATFARFERQVSRQRRDVDRAKIVTARGDNLQIACEDGGPIPESLLSALRHFRLRSGFVAARGDIEELGRLVQVAKQAELSLRSYHDRLRAQQPHIRKKETITNIERNDERTKETEPEPTPEVPAPESRTVRPSVVPPASQMKEELRTWLTARTELFGLPTLPDDAVLNQIAAHVTDEATFARFERQVSRQRPQPHSWMYFVSIAKACAEARASVAAREPTEEELRKKDTLPPGFQERFAARIGEGSVESFRTTTGNPVATFEDMDSAWRALLEEFGVLDRCTIPPEEAPS